MRKRHCRWPFLCLCAQVASKLEAYPNTCRLDESIKVAASLQTYDSWQTNVAGPKKPQTYVVVAKTNISIPDCMMVRGCDSKRKWASSSWQHDCRRRQPDWELCGCCHFRTSNSWLRDCQKIDFERKSNVHFLTAWLPETWTWMKTEHQIPDCMLVRNLVLAWNWSSISWLDIHEKIRGLLNTSWQLSFIQHAWNHCVSWDVWYVKQIIGLCYLASNSRPMQSRLVSLDSDTKFQNNSASRQNRTLPTVHSGQCIVVQQDHSVLWPRPPRPLGSVWWGHSTKPASQG